MPSLALASMMHSNLGGYEVKPQYGLLKIVQFAK